MQDIEQVVQEHSEKLAEVEAELHKAETERQEIKLSAEEQIAQLRQELELAARNRISYQQEIHSILTQNILDIKSLKQCQEKIELLERQLGWDRR